MLIIHRGFFKQQQHFRIISGRSYCVSSHKMLAMCVESVVQKLQQQGIVLRFEKYGPDPILNPGIF